MRLIDFDNLENNSWHAVTELPFENGEDNFRPDITLLVNGLPLGNPAFFERSVMPIVMRNFQGSPPEPDAETRRLIQYLNESQGRLPFG